VIAAVAAGHPATADAGLEILAAGGTAADAAVAASLASCVAETIMTGLLGGGHAVYWDAASARARMLDCFVAVPGLGAPAGEAEVIDLAVPFGEEIVHYAVGPATAAVPGLPAGLDTLWQAHGRLPWPRLVEPALRIAHDGAELPQAHAACLAMLEPVFTMNEGAQLYAPQGELLTAGAVVEQPGLVHAFETVAGEGAGTFYAGAIADALLELSAERGGLITRDDLHAYRAEWREPVAVGYLDGHVLTRGGLSGVPAALGRLPRLAGRSAAERVLALVDALAAPGDRDGHTTNIVTTDTSGNACVLTSTLGLGSGDWVPGYDLHLNSMLGEGDLVVAPLIPGERVESMTSPLVALDSDGHPVLAAGGAGGTRIPSAIVGVLEGILDERLAAQEAVDRPRFVAAARVVNAEPGVPEDGLEALEQRGWGVRRWRSLHHYFGGVSVVTTSGAAGDPRRDGAARVL
jgi:gamma-glutamyltranspeptidase/glutathione hydrolase